MTGHYMSTLGLQKMQSPARMNGILSYDGCLPFTLYMHCVVSTVRPLAGGTMEVKLADTLTLLNPDRLTGCGLGGSQ
ncbi:hypothetical protein BO71DRAFT_100972 [Aspergillus ellipticus CBS 707.79]|uniref:Uncharacterized protein n=1 Tax=Aspergillus ellipticus CBS 707.79 TaxID=1448320 RepID=A0A319D5E0_9EURO|nr:hypothetical protein BO71DRAFT_100972 [Aspergillus ellipticus CBS 707.79]